MSKNTTRQLLAEVKFSSLSSLELWEKLGLAQPRVEKKSTGEFFSPPPFQDEENRAAFEAFLQDCDIAIQEEEPETIQISNEKGSIFIWSLLKEQSKRKSKKLSSVHHLFKDKVFETISRESGRKKITFYEEDFDVISNYLEEKDLVKTSKDGIRISRDFEKLFHEKYGWLVF